MPETPERQPGACALAADFGPDAEALRRIEMEDRCLYLMSRPSGVALEPTTACNLRCLMCPQREGSAGPEWRGYHMGREVFDAVAEFFPGAQVFFGGVGEPFTHPDFPSMLERAAREGREVSVVTNGTLLTPALCERVVELRVHQIIISMDARSPAIYERIRGFPLKKTLENVRNLIEARRRSGSLRPCVTFNFTMMRCNMAEMSAVAELAAELGADEVMYGHLGYPGFNPSRFEREERLDYGDPAVLDSMHRAQETALRLGVRTQFPDSLAILGKYEALSPYALRKRSTKPAGVQNGAEEQMESPAEKAYYEALRRVEESSRTEGNGAGQMAAASAAPLARVYRQAFAQVGEATARVLPQLGAANPENDSTRGAAFERAPVPADDAFRTLFIGRAGDVYLHCEAYHLRADLLGRLTENTIAEVWNGEPIIKLRRWWYAMQDCADPASAYEKGLHV